MTELYTVKLQGSSDLELQQAVVRWRTVGRHHRMGDSPPTLARVTYEVVVEGKVFGDTAIATITALGTLVSDYLDKQVLPTYLRIEDEAGDPVDQVGLIDESSDSWEQLRIVDHELLTNPDDPREGRSQVSYRLVFQAERVFASSEGLLDLDQVYEEGGNDQGLKFRRLVSRVRFAESSANTPTTAAVLALVRLSKPVGWARQDPTNHPDGIHVRWDDYPRNRVATITSHVAQQNSSVPTGASGGQKSIERREDFALGVLRLVTRASVDGSSDALGWVEEQKDPEAKGYTLNDEIQRAASGQFEELEVLTDFLGGKVTQVRPERTLSGGGQMVSTTLVSAGAAPIIRPGPFTPLELTEVIDLHALGVESFDDIPQNLAPGPPGDWIEVEPEGTDFLPAVQEYGRDAAQTLTRRRVTRRWIFRGQGDPRDDEAFRDWLMKPIRREFTL